MFKKRGKRLGGRDDFEKKNANVTNAIPKLIYMEVSSRLDNGKGIKIKGKIGDGLTHVENPRYSQKTPRKALNETCEKKNVKKATYIRCFDFPKI